MTTAIDDRLLGSLGTMRFMVVKHRLRSDKPFIAVATLVLFASSRPRSLRTRNTFMVLQSRREDYSPKGQAPAAGASKRAVRRGATAFHETPPAQASVRSDARAWRA